MAVKSGSLLQLRTECYKGIIDKSQVVTVKGNPFCIGEHVCVSLEGHDGIFLLDEFSELGQTEPALPASVETWNEEVSLEAAAETFEALANLGKKIVDEIAEGIACVEEIIDCAIKEDERKKRSRQDVAPFKKHGHR